MADVKLSDYAGHIFLEMIKAREMADAYSRTVAERYAQDSVMKHFPAPRFKMPNVRLSIPILISGARFKQLVRFGFPKEEFVEFVVSRAIGVQVHVAVTYLKDPRGRLDRARSPEVERVVFDFYEQLRANREPQYPDPIVTVMWGQIFRTGLREAGLLEVYIESDPAQKLLADTTREVLKMVRQRTVVEKTEIESLLVDPETNVVKNGSSETSVCTVDVELIEEGVYFRSVQDERTEQTHTIVEFE